MAKILLTGGAGYIGCHIAAALIEKGYEPLIVDDFSNSDPDVARGLSELTGREVRIHELDCRNFEALSRLVADEGGVAGIIHLAAYKAVGESVSNPLKYYDNNVGTMISVLKIARENPDVALVLSSSCTVYGQPDTPEVDEESPLMPYSPYGRTKLMSENMMRDYLDSSDSSRGVILRYFNPIGAHPSALIGELPLGVPDNLVPYITQTAAGLRDELVIFGNDYDTTDGTCVRDFIHVCDLADSHIAALERALSIPAKRCEVYNIGTGRGHSVRELVELFIREMGCTLRVRYGPRRSGDVRAIFANVDKAGRHLDWRARYSLGEALKHAWNWQQRLSSKS